MQDFSPECYFKHCSPLLLCVALTSRLNPKWTQKKGFSLTNLPCQKKKSFVFDPSAVSLPASVSLHDLFPLGNAPVSVQTNTGTSSIPLVLLHLSSAIAPALRFFSFTPPAGSCLRCHLCTASFVVLVGLQIMCQVLAVNGSLLPSLLSAKHK